MAKGGKQPGAGRPKGSTNVPRFSDYVTEKDRKQFVEFVLATYMGDMRLAQWMGDHLFMKPRQDVDVTTNGKELPVPIINLSQPK
jgi:hypothetical protein